MMNRHLLTTAAVVSLVTVALGQSAFERPAAQSGVFGAVRLYNTSRINTDGLEFCPVVYENGLVYVSRPKNGPVDPRTGETFFELYYAELDPNGVPGKPQSFSTEINSAYHEGPVSFSRDGSFIYFTRTNSHKGVRRADERGRSGLKIYQAQRGLYDWENVIELPFNSDQFSCLHPALSPDGQRLFFASDMPGGLGGMDLYMVEQRNGVWSPPIPLGPEVNSPKNEAFPFMHESGVLFFASDGHPGLGGLDLFMIDMSSRKWGRVTNLGDPINSSEDDLGLVLLPDGKQGYFTSSRGGGFGQDDIYQFFAPDGLQNAGAINSLNGVVTVVDASTSRRLTGASIRLFALSSDGLMQNEDLYSMELVPDPATNGMVIKMTRKNEDQLGEPLTMSDRFGEAQVPLQAGSKYVLIVSKAGFFTKEIEFNVTPQGPDRPLEVLVEPSNCVNLKGMVRSDRYNLVVPNATVRITNSCTGKTDLLRSNINGEFEICLPMGCDFHLEGEKEGYEIGRSQVTTVRLRGSRSLEVDLLIHPLSDAVLKEPIREGTVIVLQNIYYDFNKSVIRKGDAHELEALVQLMELYPSMEIELGAHTDSRGPADYNLDLSLRRAESAKQFLVQRGIAADRVRAVGYGETKPRISCPDDASCTEDQHMYNRRTEVKVLRIDESVQIKYDREGAQRDN